MHTFIFDIGKTNLKCHVLDGHGTSLWSASQANEVIDADPYPHFAIEDIWQWLQQALKSAAEQYLITAINISTHGACAVLLDTNGQLVLPVLDYEYQALDESTDHYDKVRPDFATSYSPRLPAGLNLGRQLWWLKHHYPQAFSATSQLLLYPQFWAWKLSGIMAIERTSLGCHTDLWLPAENNYSSLIDDLELRHALPALANNDDAIGTILAEVAATTGLPEKCQIYAGVHDSNASLASHLYGRAFCENTGNDKNQTFAIVSAGTWVITMAMGANPANLIEARDMLANVNVYGEAVCCARFMGGREFEQICQLTGAAATDPVDTSDIEQLIAEQMYALPSFVAGCGPYPTHKGELYCALTQASGQAKHITNGKALATLYTALMIDTQLDLLTVTGDIIFGSTSKKNPLICQLLAQLRPHQRILMSGDEASTVKGCWSLTRKSQNSNQTNTQPLGNAPNCSYEIAVPCNIAELSSYRAIWHNLIEQTKATP